MKINKLTLVVILAFAVTAFGQLIEIKPDTPKPTPTPKPFVALAELDALEKGDEPVQLVYVRPKRDAWTFIGSSTGSPRKDLYYRDYSYKHGRGQAWLKWVIKSPIRTTAKTKSVRNLSYYLQFASADCEDKRITLEQATLYDKRNRQILMGFGFAFTTFSEKVLPGSIGEMIWYKFCHD